MKREQAKELFRNDLNAYGKPKSIISKINLIYDEFERENLNKIDKTKLKEKLINAIENVTSKYKGGDIFIGYFNNASDFEMVQIKHDDLINDVLHVIYNDL